MKRLMLFISILLVLSSNVYALNLKTAYLLALEFDSTYLAANEVQRAALEILPSARSELLPSLSLQASTTEIDEELTTREASSLSFNSGKHDTHNYNFVLNQVVFNRSVFTNYRKAKLSAKLASIELKNLRQDLIIRVSRAYFNVLQATDDQALAAVNLESAKQQYEHNKDRFDFGLITLAEYQQTVARWKLAVVNMIRANNQRREAKRLLEVTTGETATDFAGLRDDIDKNDLYESPDKEWKNLILESNLDFIKAELNLEIAEKEISIKRSAHHPSVDLVLKSNTDSGDGGLGGIGVRDKTNTAMLQFSMPLFRGGGILSDVRAAKHLRNAAEQDLKTSRLAILREANRLYDLSQTQIDIVEALDSASEASRLAKEAKEEGFSAGLGSNIDVLDAQRDFFQATLDANSARYEALILGLTLKRLDGSLAINDLEKVNNLMVSETLKENNDGVFENRENDNE